MTKEVAKKEEQNMSMMVQDLGAGGEEILSSDIVIPRLLLMQGLSDLVAQGKAKAGEMVTSLTEKAIGNSTTPVSFIPLTYQNKWIIQEKVGKKFEFRGVEPMTSANQDLPWNFTQDGNEWKRVKCLDLFALLPSDIEAEMKEMERAKTTGEMPDPSTALMPVMISFRSTSYSAGRDVVSHFARAKKYNVRGYVSTFNLSCYQEKNDMGTFYVFEAKQSGKTDVNFLGTCEEWYKILTSGKVKTDDRDLHEKDAKDTTEY